MKIDLILLGEPQLPIFWSLGEVSIVQQSSAAINSIVDKAASSSGVDAWLFWDPALGSPNGQAIKGIFCSQGDVWHAGLKLGTRGLPQAVDFVNPIWMLNCDPDKDVAAASWRLSFRACMVRTEVLSKMGGLRSGFQSLQGAGLEWGHYLIKHGVMTRYVPELVSDIMPLSDNSLSVHDELLFTKLRFPSFWYRWLLFRNLLSGILPRLEVLKNVPRLAGIDQPDRVRCSDYRSKKTNASSILIDDRVTVLLPTIDRYAYLRPLLDQLRRQTVAPYEIIVIDQTPLPKRDVSIPDEFADLPLIWIEREQAGQCSSRNAGLRVSTGDFVLFLDDDDEIFDDLIERHLDCFNNYGCDVSCGVVEEVGIASPPDSSSAVRASDVFPTNNTMIRRNVLNRSGLFDLAYDRGQRADGDLGMRVYLSGHHMVLNPTISLIHHHAPVGGLRVHGQRIVTRATSRKSLTQKNLASRSDIYLALRYFSSRQVCEMLWISALSSMSIHGNWFRKLLKATIGSIMLPAVLVQLGRNYDDAERMLEKYPQIEYLQNNTAEELD